MLVNYSSRTPSWQHTLANELTCVGRGLHSGQRVCLRLRPAPPDTGIRFLRTDVACGRGAIPADWRCLVESELCTVLANDCGTTVGTVEHLLAALRGCGIDNAIVELDGPEVPIMDGSAAPYVSLLLRLGTARQAAARHALFITRPVVASESDRYAMLLPGRRARMTVEIDFPGPVIGRQRYGLALDSDSFAREIAPARTFGFAHELQALRARGLAKGGSLQSAILIDGAQIANEDGLRFRDEFVRHKALDCIGDLALLGMPVIGHFVAHKPGHRIIHQLLRALNGASDSASLVILDGDESEVATAPKDSATHTAPGPKRAAAAAKSGSGETN